MEKLTDRSPRTPPAPSLKDLGGSDPDFTGDLTTQEFIRSIRGDPDARSSTKKIDFPHLEVRRDENNGAKLRAVFLNGVPLHHFGDTQNADAYLRKVREALETPIAPEQTGVTNEPAD